MVKPHWEVQHDWWIDDINFELGQIWEFKQLLRKHPEDSMGDTFRELISTTELKLKGILKDYKKLYGDRPNIAKMRRAIEE